MRGKGSRLNFFRPDKKKKKRKNNFLEIKQRMNSSNSTNTNSNNIVVNVRDAMSDSIRAVAIDPRVVRTGADLAASLAASSNARLLVDGRVVAPTDTLPADISQKTVFLVSPKIAAPAAPAVVVTTDRVVKVQFNGELRRFRLKASDTLRDVRAQCAALFGSAYHDELRITWTDSEGDVITCASDVEWRECVREFADATAIRLVLVDTGAPRFQDGPAPQVLGFSRGAVDDESSSPAALLQPANADAKAVAREVPDVLASFFPGGKILPHNIPDFLRASVRAIQRAPHVVDLDIDLEALHNALSRHAIDLLEQHKYVEARELLARLIAWKSTPVSWYNLACAHSLIGDANDALVSLKASIDQGYNNLGHMLNDPDLENVRGQPDFLLLVQELLSRDGVAQ